MKVFISWSGTLSKHIAEILDSWIPSVLQSVKTWISTQDIDKGSIWFKDINEQLSDTSLGIVCLTPENINSPWILFEAGSLCKGLSKNRVCTLLINLTYQQLSPPLSHFNGTLPTKTEMFNLIKTINTNNNKNQLNETLLSNTFERWWKEFEEKYKKTINGYKPQNQISPRTNESMIEEILAISRSLQQNIQNLLMDKNIFLPLLGSSLPSNTVNDDQYKKLKDDQYRKLIQAYLDSKKQ